MATLLLANVLLSLQSFNRDYKRERSNGLRLANKFYRYEPSASLQGGNNIFPWAAYRQLNGWPTEPPRPSLPPGCLPSWEEITTEFETKFPDEFQLAHLTANYDNLLEREAEKVMKLWREMLAHLEERLEDNAKYCSDPLCTRGRQALGFHGLCSLHAGVFGDAPVVDFFNAFNDLCKHFDVFILQEHQLRLYAILGPRPDDAANDRNLASVLSDILRVRYFGIGASYRPYLHFASAAPGSAKSSQSESATVAYLRDHCYNAGRVPYLATAHTDKCTLFVKLMETSCINYFGEDRSFDLANMARGKTFPPILRHLLPDISKDMDTFEAISALYSFTCLLVKPLIPPVKVPSKEAIKTFNWFKADYDRNKKLLSKGKDEDEEDELPAVSYTAFYRSVLTSSDPMTAKGLCLASFAHPSTKSIMRTLVSSRLLVGAYLDTFVRILPDALDFRPSSADEIIPKPGMAGASFCTYATLYRPAVLSCAATQTYLTLASCIDFINERYFTEEDFSLYSNVCLPIIQDLEEEGILVEETMSSRSDELGTAAYPRRLWRYATHDRFFPKYLYLAGYLDATGWVLAAAALWPKSTWTANRLFSHLEQQGEKTPPMSRQNLGTILPRRPGVFTAVASITEAGSVVKTTQPGYALSETYLRVAQEEEEAARARRALRGKIEPTPYVWPDAASFHSAANVEISAATTLGTCLRTYCRPDKKVTIGKNACPECAFPCASTKALKAHLSTAHPESPKGIATLKCESCEATFLLDSHLRRHTRDRHPTTPKFQCSKCPVKLASQRNLEKHLERHSKKEKALVQFRQTPLLNCPKCKRSFATRAGLKRHDSVKHTDKTKGRYECTNCLRSYKSLYGCRSHKCKAPKHEGLSIKVLAPLVKTPVGNVSGGPGHRKGGHQTSFVFCPKCGQPFLNQHGLYRHDTLVHFGKPKGPFRCTKCLSSFTRRTGLRKHKCIPPPHEALSIKVTTTSPGSMLEESISDESIADDLVNEESISDESIADDLMNEESIAEVSTAVAFPFARLATASVATFAKVPTAFAVSMPKEPITDDPMADEPMPQEAPVQPSAAAASPTVNAPGANVMPPNALVGSLERGPTRAEAIFLRPTARVAPLARDSTALFAAPVPAEPMDDDRLIQEAQPSVAVEAPTVNAPGANLSLERAPLEAVDDEPMPQEAPVQPLAAVEAPTANVANLAFDRTPFAPISVGCGRGRGKTGRGRITKRETGEVGKCPIDLCQENSWSSRKELERHYATFHCATDGGFQCPGCRRTYSSVAVLLLHVPVHRS